MAGFTSTNTEHLTRTAVWDPQLKKVLEDMLIGTRYVRMIPYWGGGTLNMPSIGQMLSRNYIEGQQVLYDAFDTGNFQFTPNEYKSSATYITNKYKQDTFYMNEIMSSFVPAMARSIAVAQEAKILSVGPDGQTAAATNTINGAYHRWIGGGTSETLSIIDFAKANVALDVANVPQQGRVAIIDPTAAYALGTLTNIVNVSNNPTWGGIVSTGHMTGMRFVYNVMGFDVYTSNNLKKNTTTETIAGVTAALGVHNLFFSAASDVLPFVGTVAQAPKVDSSYNKDWQRDEYVTTARYDYAFFRPENFVDIITDTDQVF